VIIEFPKKYKVVVFFDSDPVAFVDVPSEYHQALADLLMRQPWIDAVRREFSTAQVSISRAYEITSEQAHAALCQLCEHVMSPPAEVDRDVWGEAIGEVSA
jgi:hypothetical protein